MKISLKWLKEYIPELKGSAQSIADQLTFSGLEVEGIQELGKDIEGVVIGKVLEREKHPQADRLSLCKVTDGKETFTVVCGAPNVEAGKKYPFAKLNAQLTGGFTIKEAKIRGVQSSGMLCSAQELGLSEESKGILELPDDAPLGKNFVNYYGMKDILFEIGLTPNRGDCASHLGIAIDLAASTGLHIKYPVAKRVKGSFSLKEIVDVKVLAKKETPRYMAMAIKNVQVAPSPDWLRQKLEIIGLRSVNNIVDVTNYVMMSLGHPLHAFDARSLVGKAIRVKKITEDTEFDTLDGQKLKLIAGDLVISDKDRPVALAGVMGGLDSEIKNDTTEIVIEAASFDPAVVRSSARRLGCHSDSSYRFERGVPASSVPLALNMAAQLILEIAGGQASIDQFDHYPVKKETWNVSLRADKLESILGIKIPAKEVTKLLKALGLNPQKNTKGWKTTIPDRRSDLTREIDLVEEVIRLYGFDKIPSSLPRMILHPSKEASNNRIEEAVKSFFVHRGFFECLQYGFSNPEELNKIEGDNEKPLLLKNPISSALSIMRTHTLTGLLNIYVKHRSQKSSPVKIFNCQPIFKNDSQQTVLSGLMGGVSGQENWKTHKTKIDFFTLKAILIDLFSQAHIACEFSIEEQCSYLHPGQSIRMEVLGKLLGRAGRVHPQVSQQWELDEPIYFFEIDYDTFSSLYGTKPVQFASLTSFPSVGRDLAILADKGLTNIKILNEINKLNISWLKDIQLFDVYEGDNLPQGKKSLAYTLIYQDPKRTLNDQEVNEIHFKLVDHLKTKLGVELR